MLLPLRKVGRKGKPVSPAIEEAPPQVPARPAVQEAFSFRKQMTEEPAPRFKGPPIEPEFIRKGLAGAIPGLVHGTYEAIKQGDIEAYTQPFQETQEAFTYEPRTSIPIWY